MVEEADTSVSAQTAETQKVETEQTVETIAAEMGWSPKDQWRGDESEWKDAVTFLREGGKIQKHKSDEVRQLKKSIADLENKLDRAVGSTAASIKKALDIQKSELEKEKKKAFENQDFEGFQNADRKQKELEKQSSEVEDHKPDASRQKAFDDGFSLFREKHDWYDSNRTMRAYALQAAKSVMDADPNISPDEYYAEIETLVKRQFPEKFERQKPAPGALGDTAPRRSTQKKDFDSMPEAARRIWQENFSDITSRESYAKAYWSNEVPNE